MIPLRVLRPALFTVVVVLLSFTAPFVVHGAGVRWKAFLDKPDSWYRSSGGTTVIANVLSYQSDQGSWPKNIDTTGSPYIGDRSRLHGTLDNGATVGELRLLARAFRSTANDRALVAFVKGLDHLLRAQYPTGGWPQFYPPGKGYARHITFNDGAMVNVLELLSDVARSPDFSFVDTGRRSASAKAFADGITCILKCQVEVNGEPTIWCAQHDEVTLEPRWGRTFEPPALTSAESAGILRLLMSLDNPGPEIMQAVHAGARWFERSRMEGIRQTQLSGDKVIVSDKNAPPLWPRFSETRTNRPIFCGRDGVIKFDIDQIEPERRNGYAWYGTWGSDVAVRYVRWKTRWDPEGRPEQ